MAKIIIYFFAALLLVTCSGGEEKSKVEEFTDKKGHELSKAIKDPMDKARKAVHDVEKRYK